MLSVTPGNRHILTPLSLIYISKLGSVLEKLIKSHAPLIFTNNSNVCSSMFFIPYDTKIFGSNVSIFKWKSKIISVDLVIEWIIPCNHILVYLSAYL